VTANLALLTEEEEQTLAPPVDSARHSALGASIRWSALVILFVLTLELTCRIEDWIRFRTPPFSPIASQTDLLVRDADGVHGRPNARFQKWAMNALGTRGPAASLSKAPGTTRVVVVGASETFGLYESPGKEYPRQLEDSLNHALASRPECSPSGTRRYEVLNAAMPGMSLPTIDEDVRNRVRRFGADVVIVYPTPAQYLEDQPPRAATPDSSGRAAEPPLAWALHPRITHRLREQIKTALPEFLKTWMRRRETEQYVRANPPGWRFSSIPADRLAQYGADLRHLVGTIRSTGAVAVVATHANVFMQPGGIDRDLLLAWERFYPRAPGAIIVAFDSAARAETLRAAADSSVATVDLATRLSASPRAAFSDFSHFSDEGAAIVAGTLASSILSIAESRTACGS
jgi:hypothetical protein